jgi:hypothetical protein
MSYVIRLTPTEHSALLGILVNHARQPDATQEWVDVVNEKTTTLGDLMTLVGTAEWESSAIRKGQCVAFDEHGKEVAWLVEGDPSLVISTIKSGQGTLIIRPSHKD